MSANAHARSQLRAKSDQISYLRSIVIDYASETIKKQETGAKSVPVSNVNREDQGIC